MPESRGRSTSGDLWGVVVPYSHLLLCKFCCSPGISHMPHGALTGLKALISYGSRVTRLGFWGGDFLPPRADLLPERAGGPSSPPWHSPEQLLCLNQELEAEG